MLVDPRKLTALIDAAKRLAIEYRKLTGRPLGVTGEIGEYEAARLLKLKLSPVRQCGYDAVQKDGKKFQVKTRCLLADCKPGQKLGSINRVKEWDAVLLVLLDQDFQPTEIHEAQRADILAALEVPGSKARERGALSVSKFRSIAVLVWQRPKKRPLA
jgi:hypothetical protein